MSGERRSKKTVLKRGTRVSLAFATIVALVAAMVFTWAPVAGSAPGWSAPVIVSTGSLTNNWDPQAALDSDGYPHAVWEANDGTDRIYYSEFNGNTWTAPVNISTGSTTNNRDPQVGVGPDGDPLVVWSGNDGSTDHIYYANNTDGAWSAPQAVYSGASLTDNTSPRMALDDLGQPHLVWRGYDGAKYRIFYSTNSGSGWAIPRNISTTLAVTDNREPQITLDYGGNPHIVWSGYDGAQWQVYYKTGAGPLVLSSSATSTANSHPQVAVDPDDHPHVTWYGNDGATDQVYYSAYDGSSWSSQVKVSNGTPTANQYPRIVADPDGHPHVVWFGHNGTSNQVYYSTDTGSGWPVSPTDLSPATISNADPDIALDFEGNPYVVWYGNDGGTVPTERIYYTENRGSGWSTQVSLSDTSTANGGPLIYLDAGRNRHVLWYGSDGGTDRVYYSEFIATYRVIAEVTSGHGIADPVDQWVDSQTTATVDLSPDAGYGIASILDNGVEQDLADPYTIPTISARHHVQVTYATNTFYFAEGYTGTGFQEYLCLGNPYDDTREVLVTFLFTDGSKWTQKFYVPELARITVDVNQMIGPGRDVSIMCESPYPFIAERPLYFDYTGGGGSWTGGSDTVGAIATSNTWYFAEGYTGTGFEEWICVLNPGADDAKLTFKFQTQEEGEKVVENVWVARHSRQTFKANELLGGVSYQTSLKLESDQPVVAERPMYFNYQGTIGWNWTGGHDVMGVPALARDYYFAEGTTRAGFEEWLTLQNPGGSDITIYAVYQLASGAPVEKEYVVGAGYRETIYVPNEVGPEQDVSVYLFSSSDFLAERPMYFDYQGTAARGWTGGHCVIGAFAQADNWFLAEGYTGDNFEEWLCIQNTGGVAAGVEITYYPEGGADPIVRAHTVAPYSRYTVNVNSDAGPGLAICTEVLSDQPVIVERPIYFNFHGEWTGGHDVVGYAP